MGISEENVPILFNKFDINRDQTLSVDEFLKTVRGDLTFGRVAVLSRAFDSLDPENLGRIPI
jgi:Ca2+-binding EF-hand superfamily protein